MRNQLTCKRRSSRRPTLEVVPQGSRAPTRVIVEAPKGEAVAAQPEAQEEEELLEGKDTGKTAIKEM